MCNRRLDGGRAFALGRGQNLRPLFAATRLVEPSTPKAEAKVRADLIDNLRHRGGYMTSSPQPSAALVRAEIILRSV